MVEKCDTTEVLNSLSEPLPNGEVDVLRRRLLQAAVVVGGASMLPLSLVERAGAIPLNPNQQGVLVHITMAGGNDALNMVAPFQMGAYHDARGSLAITEANGLPVSSTRALHPELSTVASKWEAGQVAIVDGVGLPVKNLSHFTSMAQWMSGNMSTINSNWSSGWIGRYLDGSTNPLAGVHIGTSVPLLVRGNTYNSIGLPSRSSEVYSPGTTGNGINQDLAIQQFSAQSTGRGFLADRVASEAKSAVDAAATLAPVYDGTDLNGSFASQMDLVASLINANLGIKVFSLIYGSFDTHSGQAYPHGELLKDFNDGLNAFYARINSSMEAKTAVVTASEFGRRVAANDSGGTDHGDASSVMVIGSGVKGGFYGELPSLTQLDNVGNLNPTVDYRSVYGTLLSNWMDSDSNEIFGGNFEELDFLKTEADETTTPPVVVDPGPGTTTDPEPTTDKKEEVKADPYLGFLTLPPTVIHKYRAEVTRLYVACFLRLPDMSGLEYWLGQRREGQTLESIADQFTSSAEFQKRYGKLGNEKFVKLIYKNVLKRTPADKALNHWVSVLDSGTSRGAVLTGFSESPEFTKKARLKVLSTETKGPIARLYRAYFLRNADVKGLHYWTGTGYPLKDISRAFAESPEFNARYKNLSNAEFVELVYRNVLKRTPSASAKRYWLSALNKGLHRGDLMLEFSEGKEFITRTKTLK